jgi:hypothetical protein
LNGFDKLLEELRKSGLPDKAWESAEDWIKIYPPPDPPDRGYLLFRRGEVPVAVMPLETAEIAQSQIAELLARWRELSEKNDELNQAAAKLINEASAYFI